MTGSAIAIPLLGATSASAAESSSWDRVAECESGGTWSADLGNGFYGGLQMSQATWDKFGGGEYASRPDLASRTQQIAVAEKVLKAQGITPWLSCATIAGLTGILTGDGDTSESTSEPSGPTDGSTGPTDGSSADPSATPSASDDGEKKDGSTPSGSAETPSPGASSSGDGSDEDRAGASTGPATGKHRGSAAPEESASGGADERASDGRASRSDGPARDAGGLTDATDGGVQGPYIPDGQHGVGDPVWLVGAEQKVSGGWV
ncbi:transglycosylase family protein [Streptomyces sp. NPDC088116]|uniref:transglycosylase family protein n=1 Tax=Streptomyces sp. NPDC088116 TaxID=3365825 RepID=UPI0037FE9B7F